MIRSVNAYLNFAGNAAEALAHYEQALGARAESLMRWGEMPGEDVPPEMASRIMHAEIRIGEGMIMMSDLPPGMPLPDRSAVHVLVQLDDPEELDRRFAALAQGGEVEMAPENTFWNARYGHLVDRFGVRWMFNCQL